MESEEWKVNSEIGTLLSYLTIHFFLLVTVMTCCDRR